MAEGVLLARLAAHGRGRAEPGCGLISGLVIALPLAVLQQADQAADKEDHDLLLLVYRLTASR